MVGVEWPEGNERAVWDLADEWYAVAAALAGPREDATTAAGEVLSGYGAVGAVAKAFDVAWRKVAEGDEAPLPLLLAVSTDLGRLVEECGCDIEGAKLEVWIELGILVVELLAMTVAVVLTAGAASPAAAAAITATRFVVQQIFKKLIAQLARKTLKKGMQEATERAAKQVTKDGLRGLGRNALRGGLLEAAEEGGVNLAIQGYQNSTGRRDGLDLADLGTSALGGLAGGAAAPLAGLGKHASSRGGQFAEHLGREMGGEMIADQAASLATGGGFVGLEDAARAAASGVTGSVVSQSDAALQARLDARLAALGGTPVSVVDTAPPTPSVPAADSGPSPVPAQRTTSDVGDTGTSAPASRTSGADATPGPVPPAPRDAGGLIEVDGSADVGGSPEASGSVGADGQADRRPETVPPVGSEPAATVTNPPSAVIPSLAPVPVSATPSLSSVPMDPVLAASPVTAPTPELAATASSVGTTATAPAVTSAPPPTVASTGSTSVHNGTPTILTPGPTPAVPSVPMAASGVASPVVSVTSTATTPVSGSGPLTATPNPTTGFSAAMPANADSGKRHKQEPPVLDLSLLEALAPKRRHSQSPPPPAPAPEPEPQQSTEPAFRSREWYERTWAADREALERRRYRGYYEAQRAWFEDQRRETLVRGLRRDAKAYYENARWLIRQALGLHRAGKRALSDRLIARAREQERLGHQQVDLAEEVREGAVLPDVTFVETEEHFRRINDDVAELATGGVETGNRSALTGDDVPPPSDQTRPYGERGGLRPPLALHQTDLERQMPREPDGSVTRTADPRQGRWFSLVNDGGPSADATRAINCLDCTLSTYETWVHGRPRVSAPRTFDGYFEGDVNRPIDGEWGGPGRVERATGGVYQRVTPSTEGLSPAAARQQVMQGYADLHRQLLTGGHGSFAFLVNTWEGGGAHAWVALNQNGTVLYLDPQIGTVSDRPPYFHRGVAHPGNVAGLEALVVGPDGRPLPLPGREVGDFSEQRPLSVRADQATAGESGPHLARTQFTAAPGQLPGSPDAPGANPDPRQPEPEPAVLRAAREGACDDRIAAGIPASTVIASAKDLDAVFSVGVSPAEVAVAADQAALGRLFPHLDETATHDLTSLFAEPRVQQMLQETWRTPPKGEPLLAETLVRQLAQRPDLVSMVLATPELMASLTARPLTLHHLAVHQNAIDVLMSVMDDISSRGPEAIVTAGTPEPEATPLTNEQRRISSSVETWVDDVDQPGFDQRRRGDSAYRRQYLDGLYVAAAEAQAELAGLAERLAWDGNQQIGQPGWRAAPKDRRRAEDKVDKYRGDASQLRDLAAAKIEFRSLGQLYSALDRLRREPDVRIVFIDDRFQRPQKSGYRDVQLLLKMSNGHIAEFRLHLAALDEVAAWEHALYEVRRDLKALAKQEGRPLRLVEQAIFDGVLRREQELFWRALLSTYREEGT
ncbi:toxin glutamine deamidase domain-containing protein [Micromonospora sagamiensis]|uniref:toxin glutamine deamidase domain-containing protein n=1 Tax=Micromonospora sagamiensis TaxID=47875 RepID=UPI001FD55A3E|nr:toxin glutamine deamidase domain-containing protein [Micromonospora sagamiensis]